MQVECTLLIYPPLLRPILLENLVLFEFEENETNTTICFLQLYQVLNNQIKVDIRFHFERKKNGQRDILHDLTNFYFLFKLF